MPLHNWIFFGSSRFSLITLETLKEKGVVPRVVVTTPDKPVGRKQIHTPPEVKVWSQENDIPVLQPEKLDLSFAEKLRSHNPELFVVASYGKILPKEILAIPRHGALNVHPSLLPRLRGASPIQTAILTENTTGVSIMLMDEGMDTGPIIAQKETPFMPWPPDTPTLERHLAREGASLLAETIPAWVQKNIREQPQDETRATYTQRIKKEDALLDLSDDPDTNLRKIQAYKQWPRAYFFTTRKGKRIRVIITEAHLENGKLVIDTVIPEGKREMPFRQFERSEN